MSLADFFARFSKTLLGAEDSEAIFLHWVASNVGHLEDATTELGVELPAEGPDFFMRLRAACLPELWRRYEHGQE